MSSPDVPIEVRGLTFRYRRGSAPIIDAYDGQFSRGAVTALTGPSGCGKSTLLYLLGLLMRPTAGHILWNGARVDSLPDGERSALRARNVGFVFQDAMLDPSRTVLANASEQAVFSGMDPDIATRRARELLDRFGVAHRADHKPGEISGGQAQRVALCRALLVAPDVVFADEPTGNLDAAAAEVVLTALEERARQGACVLIATHDMTLAARADVCVTI